MLDVVKFGDIILFVSDKDLALCFICFIVSSHLHSLIKISNLKAKAPVNIKTRHKAERAELHPLEGCCMNSLNPSQLSFSQS